MAQNNTPVKALVLAGGGARGRICGWNSHNLSTS